MKERVIEPSEIVVELPNPPKGQPKERIDQVNPWIRCIARFFDYSLFFLALLLLRKLFHGRLPLGDYDHFIPFEFFVWIPIEASLLTFWGTTPGKALLGTRVRQGKRERFDFATAVKRSFAVWIRGLGMGIPVLNGICMLFAYKRLKLMQKTSWDRDDHLQVTHAPMAPWRLYLAVFVAVVGILFYYSEKNRELTHVARGAIRSVDESSLSARAGSRFHFST